MPQFKVKDLMINILPTGPRPFAGGGDECCLDSKLCTGCSPNSGACFNTISEKGGSFTDAEDFALLKAQLRQALINVEERERIVEEIRRPQTLADIELLEQKLTAALEELKARKAEFQQKPPEKPE